MLKYLIKNINIRLILTVVIIASSTVMWPFPVNGSAGKEIRHIYFDNSPYRIRVAFDGRPHYKVVMIDKKEVMIAFKNITISKNVGRSGSGKPLLKTVRFEEQKNNVISLFAYTQTDLIRVHSKWVDKKNELIIHLIEKEGKIKREKIQEPVIERTVIKKRRISAKKKIKPKKIVTSQAASQKVEKYVQNDDKRPIYEESLIDEENKKYKGNIDDFILEIEGDPCIRKKNIKAVYNQCKKGLWKDAYVILETYIKGGRQDECTELAYFLRAYCYYKMNKESVKPQYFEAISLLQDSISYFPGTKYVPYSMAALGNSFIGMNNFTEAAGYFNIIQENYSGYPGMPEVLFEMGNIHANKKDYKKAVPLFRRIVKKHSNSVLLNEARIQLGKALFEMNSFKESLHTLNNVIAEEPNRIFEDPDLLLNIGNSYYHSGNYDQARKNLGKAYNFFPEMSNNHLVLTRIGDTYLDEGQIESANKVFKLVINDFPDTDGYIVSSMRLAPHLESSEEREEIYSEIINKFPENPMANLAMLRLGELQYNAGRIEESIETIKILMSLKSRSLRKESMYTLEKSFLSLFRKCIKEENYPRILKEYEKDKIFINRLENPELFLIVGNSYRKVHLYDRSLIMFKLAKENYDKKATPSQLSFVMAVSLQETGKPDEALKLLDTYIRSNSKGKYIVEAYSRKGKILLEKKKYKESINYFETALKRSNKKEEKAGILIDEAQAYKKLGNNKRSSLLLVKAINFLSASSENYYARISLAYRDLGEIYLNIKSYVKAADAYQMAINFADKEKEKEYPFLRFRLGESYHKGKSIKKAATAYNEVIASGDPFWGRLAEEKLQGIKLEQRLKNT